MCDCVVCFHGFKISLCREEKGASQSIRGWHHVHDGPQGGEADAGPPPGICVVGFGGFDQGVFVHGLQDLLAAVAAVQASSLGFTARGARERGGVQGLGRQHLRRAVDQVHGLHERAVEFEEIQSRHVVEGVRDDLVALHGLGLVIADIHGLVVLARRRGQLAAVDAKGGHDDRAVPR